MLSDVTRSDVAIDTIDNIIFIAHAFSLSICDLTFIYKKKEQKLCHYQI